MNLENKVNKASFNELGNKVNKAKFKWTWKTKFTRIV